MPHELRLPDREFQRRIAETQRQMASAGLEALVAFSTESEPAHVRYYSDYWPAFETAAVLIPAAGEATLLIGPESLAFARGRSRLAQILQLMDFRESSQPDYPGSKLPTWREVLAPYRPKRIGVAGWHMFPHAIHQNLVAASAGAPVVEADSVVRTVMLKKSPGELACLRRAAQLSERGLQAILAEIRPGMTEVEIAAIGSHAMLRGGAEATGYPVWCCSGPNSRQAISRPTHRAVGTGEVIHVSIGAKVEGYSASIGRPIVLGPCGADLRKFLQTGLDAENLTIDLMRGGSPAAEVTKRVHGFITERGYGPCILYGPAHGCGQMECEYPFMEKSSAWNLEPGMTFMVDVFLADAAQGFRFEDGVIITEGAAEVLSSHRREVLVL